MSNDQCKQNECGLTYNEIALDQVKYAARYEVTNHALRDSIETQTMIDHLRDRTIMQLEATVFEHKTAESSYTMRVPYPATPWQHVKYKHRSSWFMRPIVARHPVQMTNKEATVHLSKSHRFPESTMPRYPDHMGRVIVAEQGELTYG